MGESGESLSECVYLKVDACADVCVCVMFQSECAIMGACVFVRKCVCV